MNRTLAVTAPRIIVAGATTSITRGTTHRKAFLGPWDPMVRDMWLYALADAQRVHDVEVHHSTLVVTHHHTSATPRKDNLPELTARLHRDMSCAVHTLMCEQRYDAPRELFDDRPTHMLRLLDAPAQASHMLYEHLNPVAAGLVARPADMPNALFDFSVWKRGYLEIDRPPLYFGKDRPAQLQLVVTPPPLLLLAFGGDLDRLVYHMQKLADAGVRARRDARTRPPMGAQRVRRIHPWSEPRTMRESGPQPRRTFRIGARGIVATAERIAAAVEVRGFGRDHDRARIARRDGDFGQPFPFGTYQWRVLHGAPVQPQPHPDAIVTRPGPLLEDVRAELQIGERDALRADSETLLDEVRAGFVDEAADIVADSEIALAERASSTAQAASDVVVAHRLDKRDDDRPGEPPRRIIVLRDRRRGRPARDDIDRRPSRTAKHGCVSVRRIRPCKTPRI